MKKQSSDFNLVSAFCQVFCMCVSPSGSPSAVLDELIAIFKAVEIVWSKEVVA